MTATYSKPTTIPKWADTSLNVTEPSSGKKDEGWLVNEKGISSWENWKAKLIGDWFKWLNERFSDGASKDALRVLCPKTGTQTLEIDENIVRFFEVATPSQQASIRKSTSKDELQLVFSESASYYYPCLAYNLADKRLVVNLNRTGIGDDVDRSGQFEVSREGHCVIRTGTSYPGLWLEDTGVGAGVEGRWFGIDLSSKILSIGSGVYEGHIDTNFLKFDKDQDRTIVGVRLEPASNNTLDIDSLSLKWRKSYSPFAAKACAYVYADGAGNVTLGGADFNISSAEIVSHRIKLTFTNPLNGGTSYHNRKQMTIVTNQAADNFTFWVNPENDDPIHYIEIGAIDPSTGNDVFLDTNACEVAVVVFGNLNS